jgi:hypothetical protein
LFPLVYVVAPQAVRTNNLQIRRYAGAPGLYLLLDDLAFYSKVDAL